MDTNKSNSIINKRVLSVLPLASILVILFLLTEFHPLTPDSKSFFTFFLSGWLLFTLYLSVKGKRLYERYMIFIISLITIINGLYKREIFEAYFQIPIEYGACIIIAFYLLRIIFPYIKKLSSWFLSHTQEPAPDTDTNTTKNNTSKKKHAMYKFGLHTNSDTETNSQATLSNAKGDCTTAPNHKGISIGQSLLYIALTVIPFLFTYNMVTRLSQTTNYRIANTETLFHDVNSIIIVFLIGILSMVVVFTLLFCYYKLIKIMVTTIQGNENPSAYVLTIAALSAFLAKTGVLSQDTVLNLFAQGDIFSLPLLILILYPVCLLSVHALINLAKNHNVTSWILDRAIQLAKKAASIGNNILNSSIDLIAFATAGFLSSAMELIDEQEGDEEE